MGNGLGGYLGNSVPSFTTPLKKIQDTFANVAGNGVTHDILEGNFKKAGADISGHAGDRKKQAETDAGNQVNKMYDQTMGYNSQLDATGKQYLDQMDAAHNNSNATYSNAILPNLKNLMERAGQDSASSMTLQQAMDPNNSVATATRGIYNKEAQNEGKQQLASTSTLQALGNQNLATTLGSAGGPMTGGQMQALMGASQAQTGAYYAQGQQRQQSLRDQGLNMGFQRSDQAYNQGLDAQNRFGSTTMNYGNASLAQQTGNENNAALHNTVGNQSILRNQAADMQRSGQDMSAINARIAQANAQQTAQAGIATAGLGAIGTAVGAYAGGPTGAVAGNQIGTQAGNAAGSQNGSVGYQNPYGGYQSPYANQTQPNNYVQQGAQNPAPFQYNPYRTAG